MSDYIMQYYEQVPFLKSLRAKDDILVNEAENWFLIASVFWI